MKSFKRTLALILSISLFSISFGHAHAAIVTNDQIIHQAQQEIDKTTLLTMINHLDVQEQLLSMGVSSTDIKERIKQMTQEEIAQLNSQLDNLPAGGDILGIAVLIFIVFVVTDVIGATDLFPFIHPIK